MSSGVSAGSRRWLGHYKQLPSQIERLCGRRDTGPHLVHNECRMFRLAGEALAVWDAVPQM